MSDQTFHLIGVMGWPVMHSRSPLMHNYWFDQTGLPGKYVYLPLPPDRLPAALRALPALNFAGCNLTIPHKLHAMEIVDEVDEVARKIGAISCVVVRDDGSLWGTNNDWRGFLGNLKQSVPGWRQMPALPRLLVPAAARAPFATRCCWKVRPKYVWSIAPPVRAEELAEDIGGPITILRWDQRHEALDGATIIVNTTSLGMVGQPALDLSLDALALDAVAADIIYTPLETPFLAAAKARGNKTVGGLGMLLHQGPPAWKLWFDVTATVTPDLRALMEASIAGDA